MKKCEQTSMFDCEKRFKLTKPVRLIELFAGIGAQAKALENIGIQFEHYFVCENDRFAIASYNAIHGTTFAPCDVTKITAEDINVCETDKFDYIMTYSFPCTDLSTAGQMRGMSKDSGTKSSLLWEVERLLSEMNELPQVLLMENVPQVVAQKNERDFRRWLEFLAKIGYRSFAKILNAKDYGIPQRRLRMFVVSVREGWRYEFPKSVNNDLTTFDFLEKNVSDDYVLSTKMKEYIVANSGGYVVSKVVVNKNPATAITTREGHNRVNLSTYICEDLPLNSVIDKEDIYSRKIRVLTPGERLRLMGFADADYEKAASVCTKTQLYKQAGNSIVTTCLTAIFGTMTDVDYVQKINDLTVGLTERRKV